MADETREIVERAREAVASSNGQSAGVETDKAGDPFCEWIQAQAKQWDEGTEIWCLDANDVAAIRAAIDRLEMRERAGRAQTEGLLAEAERANKAEVRVRELEAKLREPDGYITVEYGNPHYRSIRAYATDRPFIYIDGGTDG